MKDSIVAEVITKFRGVVDGQVYPRTFVPGDIIYGQLAERAIRAGQAKKKSRLTTRNKMRTCAPLNK